MSKYVNYDNHDEHNVWWLTDRALDRDSRLNAAEADAKEDAEKECEFGPRWWLRAHP